MEDKDNGKNRRSQIAVKSDLHQTYRMYVALFVVYFCSENEEGTGWGWWRFDKGFCGTLKFNDSKP